MTCITVRRFHRPAELKVEALLDGKESSRGIASGHIHLADRREALVLVQVVQVVKIG
jgi:hypothetical protein